MGGYYSKPHRVDYRRSPYYKSAFNLMLYAKFRKYHIKYDEKTGNMMDLKSNKKVLIFSFDEAAFQFIGNYIKVYSLTKPEMKMDTNRYKCKAAGFYSLTPEGNDYITFIENSKKETIGEVLKEIKIENDDAIIFLIIDNFSSHRSDYVKDIAKGINIELCYLPPYSPQLQPIERKWLEIKQNVMKYKIRYIPNFREKSDDEKLDILKSLVENSFYKLSKDKGSWNYVDNCFIKPVIKKLHPRTNSNLVLEKY